MAGKNSYILIATSLFPLDLKLIGIRVASALAINRQEYFLAISIFRELKTSPCPFSKEDIT